MPYDIYHIHTSLSKQKDRCSFEVGRKDLVLDKVCGCVCPTYVCGCAHSFVHSLLVSKYLRAY